MKRVYTSAPPPNTPIQPGTQIILSEGVANNSSGRLHNGSVTINPLVSLPLHPLPPASAEHLSITRYNTPCLVFLVTVVLQRVGGGDSKQRPVRPAAAAPHPQRLSLHGGGQSGRRDRRARRQAIQAGGRALEHEARHTEHSLVRLEPVVPL